MWHLSTVLKKKQKNFHHRGVVVGGGVQLRWSRSLSLHLSLDFPDSDSPGVSHLGHQLHSRVNCSSKWSAKQCRKKDEKKKGCGHDPLPCSHHRCMTRSAQRGGHNTSQPWVVQGIHSSTWNQEKLKKQTPAIYIRIKRLTEYSSDLGEIFFPPADFQWGKRSCRGKLTGEPLHEGLVD